MRDAAGTGWPAGPAAPDMKSARPRARTLDTNAHARKERAQAGALLRGERRNLDGWWPGGDGGVLTPVPLSPSVTRQGPS